MTTTMKMILGSLAACLALGVMAAEPSITDVVVRQRWPWSRLVDINYVLSADSTTQTVDVLVNAYDGDTALTLPWTSLTGDLHDVTRGQKRIVLDPTKTAYTNELLTRFRVDLQTSPAPLYMIVDLNKTAGEVGQFEYVYESDLTNGLRGAWVRNPVTNNDTVVESVVWTGVATNDLYKTDKLVLRRIYASAFNMGDTVPPTISTTLTNDFYAGVFEVTQRQWELIKGEEPSNFTLPVVKVSYGDIRGATSNTPAVNWPATGRAVASGSFLGILRDKTGLTDFDLPTEAQWEYACRAGTTTYYNDGQEGTFNLESNEQINALGRYKWNGSGTAPVGSYLPNAWGLYDMHGNAYEFCLDWYAATLAGGEDPKGPVSSVSGRVERGGGWSYPASSCRSASRYYNNPSPSQNYLGFRVVRTLP